MNCPRRIAELAELKGSGVDHRDRFGPVCSYCGSIEPGLFMEQARLEALLLPSENGHECAVQVGRKSYFFAFEHLSKAQRIEFYWLHQRRRLRMGHPGWWRVNPFFFPSGTPLVREVELRLGDAAAESARSEGEMAVALWEKMARAAREQEGAANAPVKKFKKGFHARKRKGWVGK